MLHLNFTEKKASKIFNILLLIFILNACVSETPKTEPKQSTVIISEEPTFKIKFKDGVNSWTKQELLNLPQLRKIEIEKDPFFAGSKVSYLAVPLADLFGGVLTAEGTSILFSCLDGFSAPIDAKRLLNRDPKGAIAYLAIGQIDKEWTLGKSKEKNPGPFYLVWLNPEKSHIGSEEWPYALAGFELRSSIETEFPLITPDKNLRPKNQVYLGYKLFVKSCFACHTLNGDGHSQMGPDLNIPYNPTEYFETKWLEKLVRNPQNLRFWPQGKMHGLDQTALSDKELKSIIEYLKYMSHRKVKKI